MSGCTGGKCRWPSLARRSRPAAFSSRSRTARCCRTRSLPPHLASRLNLRIRLPSRSYDCNPSPWTTVCTDAKYRITFKFRYRLCFPIRVKRCNIKRWATRFVSLKSAEPASPRRDSINVVFHDFRALLGEEKERNERVYISWVRDAAHAKSFCVRARDGGLNECQPLGMSCRQVPSGPDGWPRKSGHRWPTDTSRTITNVASRTRGINVRFALRSVDENSVAAISPW